MTEQKMNVKDWIDQRIKPEEVEKYLDNGKDFIPDAEIERKITAARNPDPKRVRDILQKSLAVRI